MPRLIDRMLAFEERTGERIEAIAVGAPPARDYLLRQPIVEPTTRELAMHMPALLREYDDETGTPPERQATPIYAWTESWILLLNGEAGGAFPAWIPRHPGPCLPDVGGTGEWL